MAITTMIDPTAESGYFLQSTLDDGRMLDVIPLTFGRARILLSHDRFFVDDSW